MIPVTDSAPASDAILVLLVDAQVAVAEAVRRMLLGVPGMSLRHCARASEAMDFAEQVEPTVILQDLALPGIDGLALLRQYRSSAAIAQIPVIVLSSVEDPASKCQAFQAGANDYLVKLPDRIELVARIRLHGRARLAQLQRDAAAAALQQSQQQLVERNAELRSALRERLAAEAALQQRNLELQALNERLESAQGQLLQSEKMASVGQLAAGVAHEINNPIGFIGSNLSSLKKYVQDLAGLLDAYAALEPAIGNSAGLARLQAHKRNIQLDFLRTDIASLVDESLEGIGRVAKIVKDLKDFSHVDAAEWQEVDLHKGLESTLNVVSHELKYKAEVVREYGQLPLLRCLPFQLNQVFLNLLVNAAQAIPGRGTITIRTGCSATETWVQVSDTGKGIAAEHRKRIFEPFFTTKAVGTGTGLGLSVSWSIVQKHGGTIEVDSIPGRGTTFTVRLPVVRG